jgi:hypothetical protein
MNAINSFLNSMMTHVQTFFCSASLGTKIQVEVICIMNHILLSEYFWGMLEKLGYT